MSKQVEKELGIPAKNVLMTATHTTACRNSRVRLRAEDRRIRQAGQAARRSRAHRVWNRCLLHQRQSEHHRSEDQTLVGRPQLRRAIGQDRCGHQVRDAQRRADRGLLQLRHARGRRRAAGPGQRGRSRNHVEVHRRFLRRQDRRVVVVWRGRRSESHLLPADLRPARDPHQGVRQARQSTSATRCLPAARA